MTINLMHATVIYETTKKSIECDVIIKYRWSYLSKEDIKTILQARILICEMY